MNQRTNLNLKVNAFKIAFLAAIGWDVGKVVFNASAKTLLSVLEPRVAKLQKELDEEAGSKERAKAGEED